MTGESSRGTAGDGRLSERRLSALGSRLRRAAERDASGSRGHWHSHWARPRQLPLAPTPARAPTLFRVLGPCAYGGGTEVRCHPAGAARRVSGSTVLATRLAPSHGQQIPTLAPAALLRDDRTPEP